MGRWLIRSPENITREGSRVASSGGVVVASVPKPSERGGRVNVYRTKSMGRVGQTRVVE